MTPLRLYMVVREAEIAYGASDVLEPAEEGVVLAGARLLGDIEAGFFVARPIPWAQLHSKCYGRSDPNWGLSTDCAASIWPADLARAVPPGGRRMEG